MISIETVVGWGSSIAQEAWMSRSNVRVDRDGIRGSVCYNAV